MATGLPAFRKQLAATELAPAWLLAGADSVYAGEGEVALAFIEDILARLGATPEQIDRERERAHKELVAQ